MCIIHIVANNRIVDQSWIFTYFLKITLTVKKSLSRPFPVLTITAAVNKNWKIIEITWPVKVHHFHDWFFDGFWLFGSFCPPDPGPKICIILILIYKLNCSCRGRTTKVIMNQQFDQCFSTTTFIMMNINCFYVRVEHLTKYLFS
jgi:hypothetical protein